MTDLSQKNSSVNIGSWFFAKNSGKHIAKNIVLLWLKNTHVEQGGAIIRRPPRFVFLTLVLGCFCLLSFPNKMLN